MPDDKKKAPERLASATLQDASTMVGLVCWLRTASQAANDLRARFAVDAEAAATNCPRGFCCVVVDGTARDKPAELAGLRALTEAWLAGREHGRRRHPNGNCS